MSIKESRTTAGWTGYWCPVRERMSPFRVILVEDVWHLYFLPLGRGTPVCTELVCPDTSLALRLDPALKLPLVIERPDDRTLAEIAAAQSIDIAEGSASERLDRPATTSSEQIAAIVERLSMADFGVRRVAPYSWLPLVMIGGSAIGATIAVILLFGGLSLGAVLAVCAVALLVWGTCLAVRNSRSARFRRMREPLLESIRLVRADREELEAAFAEAGSQRMRIQRRVRRELQRMGAAA